MRILTLSVRFNIVGMIFFNISLSTVYTIFNRKQFCCVFVLRIRQKYYMIVLDKGGLCHE